MRSLRKRSSITLFALFAYLLAGVGVAEGTVLCIEEDGNLVIEASQNGRCGVPSEPTVTDTHCGSCVDIQVNANGNGEINVSSKKVSQQIVELGFPAASPIIYSFDKITAPTFSKHTQPGACATPASLRTTILLI